MGLGAQGLEFAEGLNLTCHKMSVSSMSKFPLKGILLQVP